MWKARLHHVTEFSTFRPSIRSLVKSNVFRQESRTYSFQRATTTRATLYGAVIFSDDWLRSSTINLNISYKLQIKKRHRQSGVMIRAFNPSTWGTEAEEVKDQPGLHSEFKAI